MIKIAILGATGIVSQQFVAALNGHPWFKVERLLTSAKSTGKSYGEALRNPQTRALEWFCDAPLVNPAAET